LIINKKQFSQRSKQPNPLPLQRRPMQAPNNSNLNQRNPQSMASQNNFNGPQPSNPRGNNFDIPESNQINVIDSNNKPTLHVSQQRNYSPEMRKPIDQIPQDATQPSRPPVTGELELSRPAMNQIPQDATN
jgi:hypothetical protein